MTAASDHKNIDERTVAGFGDEWSRFDQSGLDDGTRAQIFQDYFSIFPWESLPEHAYGADIGCGSGRWALAVAPKVGRLMLFDASSQALAVARRNLSSHHNVQFECASVDALPVSDKSLDFAYSLGVLHHVPDTAAAIDAVAAKLKSGAPFLVYLYYAFDNRGAMYRAVWRISDALRRIVSRLPMGLRFWCSQAVALCVYWPLARGAQLLDSLASCPQSWPLSYYKDKPFYVMRNDALDRLGTRLEQRFTRAEIEQLLSSAGFVDIRFSEHAPFWCAVGIKG